MYEPDPTTGQPPEPQRPQAPDPVRTAVRFIYAGAALSALELVIGLATIGSVRGAIRRAYPRYTAAHVRSLEVASITVGVVTGLIAIGLWIWMARASAGGHGYARIVGTILFGLNTVSFLLSLARPHASLALVFTLLVWLAGLGAVIMLWRRESGPYFAPQPRQ